MEPPGVVAVSSPAEAGKEWETSGLDCPPTLVGRRGVRGKVKLEPADAPAAAAQRLAPIPNVENQDGRIVDDAWNDDLLFATIDHCVKHSLSQYIRYTQIQKDEARGSEGNKRFFLKRVRHLRVLMNLIPF